jgi:hypothetical protein
MRCPVCQTPPRVVTDPVGEEDPSRARGVQEEHEYWTPKPTRTDRERVALKFTGGGRV